MLVQPCRSLFGIVERTLIRDCLVTIAAAKQWSKKDTYFFLVQSHLTSELVKMQGLSVWPFLAVALFRAR